MIQEGDYLINIQNSNFDYNLWSNALGNEIVKCYEEDNLTRNRILISFKIFKNYKLLSEALLNAENCDFDLTKSVLFYNERVIVKCYQTIFCLSIPSLNIIWQYKNNATNFYSIFYHLNKYYILCYDCLLCINYEGVFIAEIQDNYDKGLFFCEIKELEFKKDYIQLINHLNRKFLIFF